jgi:hypothetical protein
VSQPKDGAQRSCGENHRRRRDQTRDDPNGSFKREYHGFLAFRGLVVLNDRENILSSLRQTPLKVREIMKRANVANEEVCQSLLLKMRDEGVVKFDIHSGRWLIAWIAARAACDCLLGQWSSQLCRGVVDFDLEHRISRYQFSARCFSSLGGVKLRLKMAVDNHHEPFGRRSVGSWYFLRFWLVNYANWRFHRKIPSNGYR